MEIQFTPIVTQKQASELAKVAEKIYYDYYAGLIGEENIKYMLAEYQTANSVIEQIRTRKHNYYEIFCDGEFCGYFDIMYEGRRIILDKIYVSKEYRKKGIARYVVAHIEKLCRSVNANKIIVDILVKNEAACIAYKHLGFVKLKEGVMTLGNGFQTEYAEMEKKIKDFAKEAEKEDKKLAEDFLKFQQKTVDKLKEYL